MKKLFTHIFGLEVVIFFLLLGMLHLFYQTQALQERVDIQQRQLETYRTLVFNLYGKNGG